MFGGVAPVATFIACQSNDGAQRDAAIDAPEGTPVSMIADNHSHAPHSLMIPAADVEAGIDKVYHIQGMANHDHTITVTAAQFAMLKTQTAVMDTTNVAICHMHVITTTDTV